MNKLEFLDSLRSGLVGLPMTAIEDRVNFYSEMIDDRIEDGLSEEEAVAEIGNVEDIVSQIIGETPLFEIVKEKVHKKRKLRAWEIVLLTLGFPVWFPIIISLLIVIFTLYICLWVVFVCFVACALAGFMCSIIFMVEGHSLAAIFMLAAGFVLAGLSIFMFYCCILATKGTAMLLKKSVLGIKNIFVEKENE